MRGATRGSDGATASRHAANARILPRVLNPASRPCRLRTFLPKSRNHAAVSCVTELLHSPAYGPTAIESDCLHKQRCLARCCANDCTPRSCLTCPKLSVIQEPAGRNRQRPLAPRKAPEAQGSQHPQRHQRIKHPPSAVAARQEAHEEQVSDPAPSAETPEAAAGEGSGQAAPATVTATESSTPASGAIPGVGEDDQRRPEPSRPEPLHLAALPPAHPNLPLTAERRSEQYSTLRRSAPAGMLPRPSRLSKRSSASGSSGGGSATGAPGEITWGLGLMTSAAGPEALRHNRPDPELMAAYRPHPLQTARSLPTERDFMLSWSLPGL